MADFIYNPSTGDLFGRNGIVTLNDLGPSDAIFLQDPPPGSPQVAYTFTPPPNLTVAAIVVKSKLATLVLPTGQTLNSRVVVHDGGTFDLGTPGSTSTATTTLNGSVVFSGSDVTVTATGNAVITGPVDLIAATVSLAAGANVTVNGTAFVSKNNTVLGQGSTLFFSQTTFGTPAANIIKSTRTAPTANATLRFAAITNNDESTGKPTTLDLTGQPHITYQLGTVTGGTIKTSANTVIAGTTCTQSTIIGDCQLPSFSSGLAQCALENTSGIGSIDVPGGCTLGGTIDPLTFNLVDGSLTGFNPLTFATGTVINVTVDPFNFGSMTFFSQTTLNGRLHVAGSRGGGTYKIKFPPQFAAGSSVQIDQTATVEITTQQIAGQMGLDNETTIQLAGGTLKLDDAPSHLGTIQFYNASSSLLLGSASLSTSFATSGTLQDFSDSDKVIFNGATFGANAMATLSGNVLSVVDQAGKSFGTFTLTRDDTQTYVQNEFTLAAVTGGMQLTTHGVAVLAAPVVTGDTSFTVHNYFASGSPVTAAPNLTVADPGSTTIASATVAITSNFASGDILGFVNKNGIAGSYNASTGVLSLTGTATVAQYQSALNSVTYGFTGGGDPTLGGGLKDRILSWTVNDGKVTSLPATTKISENFTAPTLVFNGTVSYDTLNAPVVLNPATSLTNPNASIVSGATIAIGGGATGDVLTASTAGTGITASFDATAQVLTLNGNDTIAHYVTVLNSAAFSSTAADPTGGGTTFARAFQASVTDTAGNVATDTALANVACFAEGTGTATGDGEVPVELLRAGHLVRTAGGVLAPIVWMGQREVDCRRHSDPAAVRPIQIRPHAFGPGAPHRNLFLSPDHAAFVDGVLVPVKLLVNGTSIVTTPVTRVRYYHLELPEHAVILAEGLTVESYLESDDRFDFGEGGAIRLFPGFSARRKPSMSNQWEAFGVAPLVLAGAPLEAVRSHVASMAGSADRLSGRSAFG